MKKQLLLSFLLGVLSLSLLQLKAQTISPGEGGILYVKKGGGGDRSGDSWANAISELDDALEWVHTGWDGTDPLQVWVATGTYTPEANGFVMKNDVALYGGFDGTETSLGQRNWAANQTILSGLFPDTSPSKRLIANVFSFMNPLTNSAVLDGFILQNGYDEQNGGGIYNQYASPTLSNLIIRGNVAGWNGGGIFNTDFSNPRLTNVTISGNQAEFAKGGGMYNENSNPVLTNVTISGNWADWEGGGIANIESSPMLVNTIVWGNFPEDINFDPYSEPDIRYSLIGNGDCPLLAVCSDMASGEPGFTNAPSADAAPFIAGLYTLEEGSAAINAGDPVTSLALFPGGPDDPFDLAGRPRVFSGDGAVIDIGAYEYNGESPEPPVPSPNALSFVDPSRVEIPDADLLDLTGSYTLECWIKPDNFSLRGGLISKYHSPGANGYLLRLSGTDPYTGLDFDGMSTANGILQPGVWHHIAAVNHAGPRRLYVNGREHALTGTPVEVVANNNLLTLGADYAPDPGFFNGSMDEVRIWNVARTQEQVRTSMNVPVDPGSEGLVAYYQFDVGIPGANNSSLTYVADVTGNGNDGLAIGFAMTGSTSNWVASYAMVVPVLYEAEDVFGISFKAVWSAPEHGTADYYTLDIAMNPDFTAMVDGYNGLDVGNVTEFAVSGLPGPGTYYYCVRAVSSSSGTGAPSNVVSVLVGTDYSPDENGILYVHKGADGNQSGSSWTNAIPELADALKWVHNSWDGAGSLQVWVAEGSYFPTPFASPLDNGFRLRNNVAVYGGFAGEEASLDQRDWVANPTILTGNGERRVITNVFTSGAPLTATAILDGFILENGFDIFHGGAIYNQWASPTLSNLLIRDNAADENGGGIYNTNSAPVLSHVTIHGNTAGASGGGLYNTESSNPVLTRVTISGNTALFSGGGIYNGNGSKPKLINVLINGNACSFGGGIYSSGSETIVTLTNVTISGNSGLSSGGGILNTNASKILLHNSIIWGNQTGFQGSATTTSKEASLENSAITGATYEISHSLVANFGPGDFGAGTGNLGAAADPQFVNAPAPPATVEHVFSDGDYSLATRDSRAVNAGSNDLYTDGGGASDDNDLAGNPRIQALTVDMGAFESPYNPVGPTNGILYVNIHVDAGKTGGVDIFSDRSGSSWNNAIPELADALYWVHHGWNGAGLLEIWVAAGSYFPIPFDPPLENGFRMRDNVAIYGGFAGTEHDLDQRDWTVNETILDGHNTNRVVTNLFLPGTPLPGTARLDGFILQNGFDTGYGGAIYNESAFPTLSNLLIRNSKANDRAGGIYNLRASPVLENVTISNNESDFGGGMFNNTDSNPVLKNVTINGNMANFGGGMYNSNSDPVLTNVTISGNTVERLGGGIYNVNSSSVLTNVLISDNNAYDGGGGMYNNHTGMQTNHTALTNVTIAKNTLIHPTLGSGAGISTSGNSTVTLHNSIVRGNTKPNGTDNLAAPNGNVISISYSLLQGDPDDWEWNTGNNGIDQGGNIITGISPFSDEAGGDYSLPPGSPAIDKGSNGLYVNAGGDPGNDLDLAGNPRVQGVPIDIGAYESACAEVTLAEGGQEVSRTFSADPGYLYEACTLFAIVEPSGSEPVSGVLTATAWKEPGVIVHGNARLVARHYDLSPADNTENATATLTLFFTQDDFDTYNISYGNDNNAKLPSQEDDEAGKANLKIVQYHGSGGENGLPASYNGSRTIHPAFVTWNNGTELWEVTFQVSGFSGFFITGQGESALPVVLADFTATHQENAILLTWQTAGEINASHFEIERSTDVRSWETIGWVRAKGESDTAATYSFTDYAVHSALTLLPGRPAPYAYYRLKILDRAADRYARSFTYSRIEAVHFEKRTGSTVLVYPNPVRGKVTIAPRSRRTAHLQVCDLLGRVLMTQVIDGKTELDIRALPSGVYLVHIREGRQTEVRKLLVE